MQPARFKQAEFLLVEINNDKSTSPAVSSGEERGLLSRTAAGNRAYNNLRTDHNLKWRLNLINAELAALKRFSKLYRLSF